MHSKQLLQIDLKKILDAKMSASKKKYLPDFAIRMLEKLVCQERLNELLRYAYPAEGSAFSDRILKRLNISLNIDDSRLQSIGNQRLIFVSNHPLGGMDGIALVKVLGERFGDDNVRVLVNDLLMHVAPLSEMFVPINKYGSQRRATALQINELYASDKNICIFPAGLVSRIQKNGEIKDLEWQKAFVVKAFEYDRTVVPIKFEALNSRKFYRLAKIRKQLNIKVNLEQTLLPGEIFHSANKEFRISFGEPIPPYKLRNLGENPLSIAQKVKEILYTL